MEPFVLKYPEKKDIGLKTIVLFTLMFIPIILVLCICILCIPLMILYLVYQLVRITIISLLDWSLSDRDSLRDKFREGFQQLKHHWTSGSWD